MADSSEEGLAASGSAEDSLDGGDLPELTETRRQRRRREQAEKKAASRHKKERKRKVLPEPSRLLLVVGVMLPDPTADSVWHDVSPCYSGGNRELSPDVYTLAHNSPYATVLLCRGHFPDTSACLQRVRERDAAFGDVDPGEHYAAQAPSKLRRLDSHR